MSTIPVLILLLTLTGTALGDCVVDEIPVMENFNMSQMVGIWYETYWLPSIYEKPEEVWYDFTEVWSLTDDPDVMSVKAYGKPVINDTECDSFSDPDRYMKTEDPESAKWRMMKYINSSYSVPLNTWIIATDYNSYALTYGCYIMDNTTQTCDAAVAWVWSRTQHLSDENMELVTDKLRSLCLDISDLTKMLIGKPCIEPASPGKPTKPTKPGDTSGASHSADPLSFAVVLFASAMYGILQ